MLKSTFKCRKLLPEDYSSIRNILEQVEWIRFPFITDPDLFRKLLENADRSVVALEDSRIVGVATAMCNDVSIGYVTMLAVSPDKQGCGIASVVVKHLIGNDSNIKWVLSSAPKSVGFWEKQGFVYNQLMVKPRTFEGIDKSRHKQTDLTTKKTFKAVTRKQLSRIYRLNIYQCHQSIKQLMRTFFR